MDEDVERYGQRVLSAEWGGERRRLRSMAAVCDPNTIGVLERVGIGVGWRCLEVGAGGGSIAGWMARRVAGGDTTGRTGLVVATDVDIRFLEELSAPNVSVLRHDVTTDPLPAESFDLVHARFVLEHLPEREAVLDRMVSWLAPGGVVVVEAIAEFPVASSPNPVFRLAMSVVSAVLARTIGTDAMWARTFPAPLSGRGLTGVGAAVHLPVTGGGNASAQCWALTLAQLGPRILDLGLADTATLEQAQDLLADPGFHDFGHATAVCWGRKPGAEVRGGE